MEDRHGHLLGLGLQLSELNPQSMQYSVQLIARYKNPSRNDCFALALAKQEACPLVTGDKALRKAAEAEGVEIRGTVWVVEQMIAAGLIDAARARVAFDSMKAAGSRLPWAEVSKRLNALDD